MPVFPDRRMFRVHDSTGALALKEVPKRLAVIGGDGIGPEVINQAIRVADAAHRRVLENFTIESMIDA